MDLFRRIGVNTMENPQQLIAEHLYRSVARPAIVDYMRIGDDAEVFEVAVTEDAPIAGKTLIEANDEGLIPDDVLIVAVDRDGEDPPVTPRGSTRIETGDVVTVYSGFGADPNLTDLFGHFEDSSE
jgi:trk system potassium uptake protein TrkA